MKLKTLVVITLVVFACSVMFAEGPAKSLSSAKGSAWGSGHMSLTRQASDFYQSGTFDYSNANANGLWNANSSGYGINGQVFVSYEAPGTGASITDITFYELIDGTTGLGSGTYTILDGNVTSGSGGTTYKTGNCSSVTNSYTGITGFGLPLYAITCNIKKAVKLKAGVSYWINFDPNIYLLGYLGDIEDMPDATYYGGGSDEFYNSYFNSSAFGYTFAPTWTYSSGGACGGIGCDDFMISLSGTL